MMFTSEQHNRRSCGQDWTALTAQESLSMGFVFGMWKNFEQGRLGALLRQTLQTSFQDFFKFLLRDLL